MASSDSAITSASFDELNTQLQSSALKATRNSMLLPADVNFHRTMDTEFSKDLDVFSTRALSVANKLLTLVGTADSSGKGKGKLESEEDVVDNFHSLVVDVMDQMMEKTDISLDEFLGRNKAPAIAINSKASTVNKKPAAPKTKGALDSSLQHASHLPKPQLKFKKKVENNDIPWRPSLSHKYNAQVPLGYNYHDSNVEMETEGLLVKLHPYRYEITHIPYPSRMFETSTPIPPLPFESTTFKWVATTSDLESLLNELRKATEIAVDLEHHSYRSYAGFLCLMQISTREQDWIVDLLVLREELSVLNEVFTDPKIVKVFHGAESDIVWLQQDLDVYIVNLFDTFHASKALGFPRHGLANLLEMYCDFTPDKRYQLADWRIRPLPQEMLDYARSDTHFLLYIYDNLRNALLDRALSQSQSHGINEHTTSSAVSASTSHSYPPVQALVREVLAKSEETALRVYEKETYDIEGGTGGNGWDTLAKKWNKINLYAGASAVGIPGMYREIYRKVHLWRDRVAREEDESTRYSLPNQYIFQLAEQPPADMAAMLRIFHFVPPVLRRRAKELLDVIRETVRKHLTSAAESSATDMVIDAPQPETPSSNAVATSLSADSNAVSSLWTSASLSAQPTISSLFGNIGLVPPKILGNRKSVPDLMASKSTLFGKTLSLASPQMNLDTAVSPASRFAEVVARIHSTLVIAPSAAKVTGPTVPSNATVNASSVQANTAEAQKEGTLPAAVQVELPFVPASQRSVKASTSAADDTIVVVGQARQKKRKRVKETAKSVEGKDKKIKNNESAEKEAEAFDFASAPNILDAAPAAEESAIPRKRAKQSKGGGGIYGNFPAPPKAHSELKSGNKSHTFK